MSSAKTRLAAVLGHPVSHSLSPAMFTAAFSAAKIDASYVALDVTADALGSAVRTLATARALGASITVPHKVNVLNYVHERTERVRSLGASNCLRFLDGEVCADNTDVDGFAASVKLWPQWRKHKKSPVLVVGAGGAARAVVYTLFDLGFSRVIIVNRDPSRARELVEWAAADLGPVEAGSFDALDACASEAKLIIHATSAQVRGEVLRVPLTDEHAFIDLSYGKHLPLMKLAKRECAFAIDGEEMLIQQAARAFSWWTGKKAPLQALRKGYRLGARA